MIAILLVHKVLTIIPRVALVAPTLPIRQTPPIHVAVIFAGILLDFAEPWYVWTLDILLLGPLLLLKRHLLEGDFAVYLLLSYHDDYMLWPLALRF